ncbi:MAG: amidase domain-containing protein, partial [Chloroflexota bacterium]|nr:amidase domain-containing protein [Chloroflexota bacterium]
LRYAQYQYFLEFRNIVVDASGKTATVIVVDENEVIYDLYQQLRPENPPLSHRYNVEHTIVLHKKEDQWKLVSDAYNDYLWRVLRGSGKTPEEILNDLNAKEIAPISEASSEGAEPVTADALLVDNSTHPYNGDAAAAYAMQYADNHNSDRYPDYDGLGGDCTNFISQAIYENGNASMFIPSPLPAPTTDGQDGWYFLGSLQRASAWNDVGAFHTFVTSSSFLEASPGFEWYGEGPQGSLVALNQLVKGDVIQYEHGGDTTWDHAVIVVDILNGVPQVASHSDDFYYTPYTTFQWHNKPVLDPAHIRFIHIEQSNGQPPVRSDITVGSDDAGTAPSSCSFSSGLNEVYLGKCSTTDIVSGFRFNNVQIPRGVQLKYAYLTSTVDGDFTAPINIEIFGEDSGDSATFLSTNQPSQRPLINPTTPVQWSVPEQWSFGMQWSTPQLAPIIQSITQVHPNWANGNSLSLIFKNSPGSPNVRRMISYERAAWDEFSAPARLIAAYSAAVQVFTVTYKSAATQDGWILESSETSGVGGSLNAGAATFTLGDNSTKRQYRSILHFNTAGLPDTAIVVAVSVRIKQQGSVTGSNPFVSLGDLVVDIRKPYFGTAAGLANADFEATPGTPGMGGVGSFDPTPASSWYTANLSGSAFSQINLTGTTQLRLAFSVDDNNNTVADTILFSSGNNGTASNKPELIIQYYVP